MLRKLSPTPLLFAILVLALSLRLYGLENQPSWYDDFIYLETGKAYILGIEPSLPRPTYLLVVRSITLGPAYAFSEEGKWNLEHPPLAKILLGAAYVTGGWIAARFLSAVFGTISILLAYIVGKELLGSKMFGLLAAFLLSIETLHLGLSRVATIDIYAYTFGIAALYFAIRQKKEGTKRNIALFWAASGLALACKWIAALLVFPAILLTLSTKPKEVVTYSPIAPLSYLATYAWALRTFGLWGTLKAVFWPLNPLLWSLTYRSWGLRISPIYGFKMWNFWFGFCPANYVAAGDYFTYVIMISYPLWIPASVLLPIITYTWLRKKGFRELVVTLIGSSTLIPCLLLWGWVWYFLPASLYIVLCHALVGKELLRCSRKTCIAYYTLISTSALAFLWWAYPLLIGRGHFVWR